MSGNNSRIMHTQSLYNNQDQQFYDNSSYPQNQDQPYSNQNNLFYRGQQGSYNQSQNHPEMEEKHIFRKQNDPELNRQQSMEGHFMPRQNWHQSQPVNQMQYSNYNQSIPHHENFQRGMGNEMRNMNDMRNRNDMRNMNEMRNMNDISNLNDTGNLNEISNINEMSNMNNFRNMNGMNQRVHQSEYNMPQNQNNNRFGGNPFNNFDEERAHSVHQMQRPMHDNYQQFPQNRVHVGSTGMTPGQMMGRPQSKKSLYIGGNNFLGSGDAHSVRSLQQNVFLNRYEDDCLYMNLEEEYLHKVSKRMGKSAHVSINKSMYNFK